MLFEKNKQVCQENCREFLRGSRSRKSVHRSSTEVIQLPVFYEKMGKSGKSGKVNRDEPTDITWIEKLPGCVELFQ